MARRLIKLVLIAAVAALVVGMVLGSRSSYGTKHLKTAEGTARLQDATTGLVSFDEEDGDLQSAFRAAAVSWESGSKHGQGDPPCLVEGKNVPVTVGYLDVAFPSGGGVDGLVVWLRCP